MLKYLIKLGQAFIRLTMGVYWILGSGECRLASDREVVDQDVQKSMIHEFFPSASIVIVLLLFHDSLYSYNSKT